MRDAAAAAAMSDPTMNHWFQRRWVERPAAAPPHSIIAKTPVDDEDLAVTGLELLHQWRRLRSVGVVPR